WWGASLELEADAKIDSAVGSHTPDQAPTDLLLPTVNRIDLNGPGTNNDGALRNVSGTNRVTGRVNLQSSSSIFVAPDSLNGGLPFDDVSQLTITGLVTGGAAANLTKIGQGELVLTNANTYTGLTFINEGWITIQNNQALGGTLFVDSSLPAG